MEKMLTGSLILIGPGFIFPVFLMTRNPHLILTSYAKSIGLLVLGISFIVIALTYIRIRRRSK